MSATLHVLELFWSAAILIAGILGISAGVLYLFTYAWASYIRHQGFAVDFLKAMRIFRAKQERERGKDMRRSIRYDRDEAMWTLQQGSMTLFADDWQGAVDLLECYIRPRPDAPCENSRREA